MLLLSRKRNETIMIGDDIQIQLVSMGKDNVLIGIRAPKDIPVHRQEIYDINRKYKNLFLAKIENKFLK